ncbi:MAG: PhpK family radical SAM P-methyltransferase [bacterium]|nr:PhpK family radical SAM P-methyltransferase [bacterium]
MRTIDCLIIGQNQISYEDYEKTVRDMGLHSGAYRDFRLNTLQYNNKYHSASHMYNLLCCNDMDTGNSLEPIRDVEFFNGAISYLGTYLHRRGLSFDFINSYQDEKEKLAELLKENDVLTVAITSTFYITVFPIIEIINFIRQYDTRTKIIVGGPFITTKHRNLTPEEFYYSLKLSKADFYVNSSQGEASLVKIIKALKNGGSTDGLINTYYRQGDEYVATPMQTENNPLGENMVNWDLFDRRVGPFVNVRTCISCPFACSFCGFPEHAGDHQLVTPELVERELNQLERIDTLRCVDFTDDTFNVPMKRFKQLLRMMIKNRYTFKWFSFFFFFFADRETVELMKESGCQAVLLGIESGNDQILRNMNKRATAEKFLKGIALLKEYGILTMGNFFVGFPGETEETVKSTIQFINESGLDFYRSQLWYCEPITPIFRQKNKYNLEGEGFDWSHNTMDSQTACDLIENFILSIDNSTRFPQYYFDYDNIVQLLHKGLNAGQVKKFLDAFDSGIREKIRDKFSKEVSYSVIEQIKNSCRDSVASPAESPVENDTGRYESEVSFNF